MQDGLHDLGVASTAAQSATNGKPPVLLSGWRRLEVDIRDGLDAEVDLVRPTEYGTRYEIRMTFQTPRSVLLTVRTIWQIDNEREVPRLITLYLD